MAQTKKPGKQLGGNDKSSGTGGGKSIAGGAKVADPAGAASVRHERASPSARDRGETSRADRT